MLGKETIVKNALDQGQGIVRLAPAWVPRSFCVPGRRLKLHLDDIYAFGAGRGGIDERWLASTTKADNGPLTTPDEGLSYLVFGENKVLLKEAIEICGAEILGVAMMAKYGGWPMFSKFFDNQEPLPLHIHHNDEFAENVGQKGKPEAYYFPPQLNPHGGYFPYTFFGLNPGVSRDDIRQCLQNWETADNEILQYSKAYQLKPGTGWNVPAGILHAPGSLLTYEPQVASDVFAMYQNIAWDRYLPRDLLIKDVPEAHQDDVEYLLDIIDWERNLDPDFHARRFMAPKPTRPIGQMHDAGYEENDIVYKSEAFSAKELTVFPGRDVILCDQGPYGLIVMQGTGRFGPHPVEAPSLIRFGQMTRDELFVSAEAAKNGIKITNASDCENLVILKHFGPEV
ncbi:MAG: hypothetical protein COA47_03205 [Robiginitomaculum sp.]|nr:MAG: hypothetical protein COA47_03205 [Robiginitomaculum sp.]